MRIEAISICVNYTDFLAETVKHNAQHFDRWVIVTTPEDKATLELCRRHNLEAVVSSELFRGGKFNKGRALSLGLNYLATDSWVLHLDADIVLPVRFKQMLEVAHVDKECIYGADRVCLHTWADWKRLEQSGYLHGQHGYHLCCNFPAGGEVGTRVIRGRYGYVPIGFFQLFHYGEGVHSGWRWKDYPDADSDAAHSDIKFALHWDRRKRVLLPEIVVVHLESEPAQFGVNWQGRKSKPFGPEPGSEPAPQSAPRRHGPPAPYCHCHCDCREHEHEHEHHRHHHHHHRRHEH